MDFTDLNEEYVLTKKQKRQMLELDILIASLKKGNSQRGSGELYRLVSLIRKIKYFKDLELKYDEYKEICQYLNYLFVPEGEWIIEYGTFGTRFYVILEGETCIYIPGKEKAPLWHDESSCPYYLPQKWLSCPDQMIHITELKTGASFGELALINDDPRAATVVCKTNCHFAYLEKADYQAMLKQICEKTLDILLNYFQALPYFRNWSRKSIRKLHLLFTEKPLIRHQVLFRAGEPANLVYILKDGQLDLWVKVQREGKVIGTNINNYIGPTSSEKDAQNAAARATNPLNNIANIQYESIKLSCLGQGKLIGIEDAIKDENSTYSYTVICVSATALLYSITPEDFKARIQGSEDSMKYIKEYIKQSNIQQINRLNAYSKVKKQRANVKKNIRQIRRGGNKKLKINDNAGNKNIGASVTSGSPKTITNITPNMKFSSRITPITSTTNSIYGRRTQNSSIITKPYETSMSKRLSSDISIPRTISVQNGNNIQKDVEIFRNETNDPRRSDKSTTSRDDIYTYTFHTTTVNKNNNLSPTSILLSPLDNAAYSSMESGLILAPTIKVQPYLTETRSRSQDIKPKYLLTRSSSTEINKRHNSSIINTNTQRSTQSSPQNILDANTWDRKSKRILKRKLTKALGTLRFSRLVEKNQVEYLTNRKRKIRLNERNASCPEQPYIESRGNININEHHITQDAGCDLKYNIKPKRSRISSECFDGNSHRSKSVHNKQSYMPPFSLTMVHSPKMQSKESVGKYMSKMKTQILCHRANIMKPYLMPLASNL